MWGGLLDASHREKCGSDVDTLEWHELNDIEIGAWCGIHTGESPNSNWRGG
jgi:hypothetical protein